MLADVNWIEGDASYDRATCQIVKNGTAIADGEQFFRLNDQNGDSSFYTTTGAHRTFPVSTADNTGNIISGFGATFNLVCDEEDGNVSVGAVAMTATYVPTNRTPGGISITLPTLVFDEG